MFSVKRSVTFVCALYKYILLSLLLLLLLLIESEQHNMIQNVRRNLKDVMSQAMPPTESKWPIETPSCSYVMIHQLLLNTATCPV